MITNFTEYQTAANSVAVYPGQGTVIGLAYTGLGLGEAGEVQGKIKKILRDDNGVITPEKRAALSKELGDLLWYIAQTATELTLSLATIAEENIAKLLDRTERGVIKGSGDDR